jgi:nitrogenase molybdenum-cofactor synthesis protein NifE
MGLHRLAPEPSGRMGLLWTVGTIGEAAVLEFGSMGHMVYAEKWMGQTGSTNRAKLFSTHIDEKDIALGITKRLEIALEEIIKNESAKAIFILPSTVPETIGMDIEAVCNDLQKNHQEIPIITLRKGGFKEKLHEGVEEGLHKIVKTIPKDIEKSEMPAFNIIGSCADFERFQADAKEINRLMKMNFQMDPVCVLTSDTTVSDIERMGKAHINLVIRREGMKAAQELERRFHIPYVVGRPYGWEGTKQWLAKVEKVLGCDGNASFISTEIQEGEYLRHYLKQMLMYFKGRSKIMIGSHYNIVEGIREFAEKELGMEVEKVFCEQKSYGTEEIPYASEEEWQEFLSEASAAIVMGKKTLVEHGNGDRDFILTRGVNSWNFNPYVPPFVGFRGAVHLCDLWLRHLLKFM